MLLDADLQAVVADCPAYESVISAQGYGIFLPIILLLRRQDATIACSGPAEAAPFIIPARGFCRPPLRPPTGGNIYIDILPRHRRVSNPQTIPRITASRLDCGYLRYDRRMRF